MISDAFVDHCVDLGRIAGSGTKAWNYRHVLGPLFEPYPIDPRDVITLRRAEHYLRD